MEATHEMNFARQCPVNERQQDIYHLKVETDRLIQVETILAAVEALPEKAYQEEITTHLAQKLMCRVTTIGHHSGVKTTCSSGPNSK